ncbi:hypothetical protein D1AOALGA4SA_4529 [Olavius algarvensis Delta 1 endosymbiont]|nr:hypothetical protein D1AOALGA4SA_4529 [Olavius algarvensis Delta 1 endosymbiont]
MKTPAEILFYRVLYSDMSDSNQFVCETGQAISINFRFR